MSKLRGTQIFDAPRPQRILPKKTSSLDLLIFITLHFSFLTLHVLAGDT
jgi:hypothetical protein